MERTTQVHAPYNFVPFSNKVLVRYESPEQLPPHDVLDTSLKSGEIHITMCAETPVLVADGKDSRKVHFFRGADGTYQIPGSSVRGLIRQTMQILGFGHIRAKEDLEDYQIYFRDMASSRDSAANALKQYYHTVMGMKSERINGKSRMIPQAVQSGYLYRENGKYFICPTVSPVFRVSRKHVDAAQFGEGRARTINVFYRDNGQQVQTISKTYQEKTKPGVLLFTGRPVSKVPNGLYLFPERDQDAVPISVPEIDVLSYLEDWESRRNTLKVYDPQFWALPKKDGEYKPVFYICHDQHVYFGMSRMLRIGYRYSLSQGLPKSHCRMAQSDAIILDYPHAIFGYTEKNAAYRSRVDFGALHLQGVAKELTGIQTVLGEPKPSFYPGYVQGGKNYNEDDFQLRGYKLYWLKKTAKAAEPSNQNENVGTIMYPLDQGSTFGGVIRYRNLTPDELGLLLWCIRLDEGCYHSLGMGKPYGYGRMKVTIDRLVEWDYNMMYTVTGLTGAMTEPKCLDDAVETYIRTYHNYAAASLRKKQSKQSSLRDYDEIRDFLYLRSELCEGEEVEYMPLTAFKNCRGSLPTVKEIRIEQEQKQQQKPTTKEEWMAALLEKYKRH